MFRRVFRYLAAVLAIGALLVAGAVLGVVVALALADWYFSVTR